MSTTPSSTVTGASEDPSASAPMRVLIADKFQASGVHALEHLGCDVTVEPDATATDVAALVRQHDPDVLIVRSTKVSADAISAATGLSLIVRAGAGFDTIDVDAASARGIFVANCPGKNSVAVAELAWGLILACDRRIPDQTIDLRAGRWNKKDYSKAHGLHGRTLGVVGLGQIGLEIAKRGRAFGMTVVAWSRSLTEKRAEELGVIACSSLINLAKMSDVVSVNVAATSETAGLIGAPFLHAMKTGASIVNTSRGSVIDEPALVAAVRDKGIRAGLDVFANEPGASADAFSPEIASLPGVYGTHHVGASTDQAQEAIAAEAVRIVSRYLACGEVPNCVNRATTTLATHMLTVRHLNRPGVLAHVFYTLGQGGINVEEMENIIYVGEKAACARIQLDAPLSEAHLTAIRANDNVLSLDVTRMRRR
ncbi:MAG: hypothetical protein KDA25_13180 [Phycisphaerales bacterium]|nr:hypothetical protein [Phycisphaerales bacterium]